MIATVACWWEHNRFKQKKEVQHYMREREYLDSKEHEACIPGILEQDWSRGQMLFTSWHLVNSSVALHRHLPYTIRTFIRHPEYCFMQLTCLSHQFKCWGKRLRETENFQERPANISFNQPSPHKPPNKDNKMFQASIMHMAPHGCTLVPKKNSEWGLGCCALSPVMHLFMYVWILWNILLRHTPVFPAQRLN